MGGSSYPTTYGVLRTGQLSIDQCEWHQHLEFYQEYSVLYLQLPKSLFPTNKINMQSFTFLTFFLTLLGVASAQFNIFEQMFGGGGGGQQHQQQQQNAPSDSSYYRSQVDRGAKFLTFHNAFAWNLANSSV